MALADFAALKAALDSAVCVYWTKSAVTTAASNLENAWTIAPFAGATPTTSVALSRSSVGNLWQCPEPAGAFANALYPLQVETEAQPGSNAVILLADRLNHSGGLSGTVGASEQTTNLPTAALTRYTDGVGVMAALQWYTATGSTAVTATVRYTNQAGTGSRTSQTLNLPASRAVDSISIIPLQTGDTGVRSVQGVTLSATTGSAGNFGVTLFKPLAIIPLIAGVRNYKNFFFTASMEEIHDDACLWAMVMPAGSSVPIHQCVLKLGEVA